MEVDPGQNCPLCPRLQAFREENRDRFPDWHNAPVPSFGDRQGSLLIVGLAPGLRGANRTGRPFTGDWAGDLLYETLLATGFAQGTYEERPDDSLRLIDCMVANAVRCVPPQNKPTPAEINTCRQFLSPLFGSEFRWRAIIALGRIAHESVVRAFGGKLSQFPFAHAGEHRLETPNGPRALFDSYHCSRYNTNTGVLTPEMFRAVFESVRRHLARA